LAKDNAKKQPNQNDTSTPPDYKQFN